MSVVAAGTSPNASHTQIGDSIGSALTVSLPINNTVTVAQSVGDNGFGGRDVDLYRLNLTAGDVLTMDVEIVRLKGRVGRGKGRALVGDERVCEAELMFAFAEKGEIP